MKSRGFISGLLASPFVRWFAVKFKLLPLWRTADELSPNPVLADFERMRRLMSALPPERLYALQQRLFDQMIKQWNEEATTAPRSILRS